jgi:hypothetical protein
MKKTIGFALLALCALTHGFAAPQTRAAKLYNQTPLSFEANQGQTDHQVKFLARAPGYTLFLTSDGATLAFKKQSLRMRVVGAAVNARVFGTDPLPGKANYFIGNDPAKWHSGVPTYSRVKYEAIYPGVDLVYYGEQRQLEYDFVVAPGADPALIALRLEGATASLDKGGNLIVGEARFRKPVVYQEGAGGRTFVDGRYLLHGQRAGFTVAKYDRSKPLVIDPALSYSTYLSGSNGDLGAGIAVDSAGSAYVTGYTESSDFPTTLGAYQTTLSGGSDIFVTKFSPSGTSLVYSTYLGGSGYEYNSAGASVSVYQGIAVDASGDAYVIGDTTSSDFPTTANAFQSTCTVINGNGCFSPFLTKINPTGTQLLYSTYLSGSGSSGDAVAAVALDSAGHAYLAGAAYSADFPTTPNSLTPSRPAGCITANPEGFLSEIDTTSSGVASLVYSTYLDNYSAPGSAYCTTVAGVAVDSSGHVFAAGFWMVPTTPLQPSGFVAKFDFTKPGAGAYLGSSALGSATHPAAVAIDSSGSAYVTGNVGFVDASGCFYLLGCIPATGFQTAPGGGGDAFVAKLTPDANSLVYLSYLGGSGIDQGSGIAVDASGNAYVTGLTQSTDFPLVAPIESAPDVNGQGFLTVVNANGQALIYSTLFGGTMATVPVAVAVDGPGNAYLTGYTFSTDLPVIHAFEVSFPPPPVGGTSYGPFVAKISPANSPGIAFGPDVLAFAPQDYKTTSAPQSATLYAAGSRPLHIGGIATTGSFAQTNNCGSTVPAAGSCTINVTFTPTAVGNRAGTIRVTDNASGSPQSMALTGTGNGIPKVSLAPASLTFPTTALGVTSAHKGVQIKNTGAGGLDISSMVASGDFAVTNSCPYVSPSGSCSFTVTFTPTATGARTGTILITDNAPNSPQTVTLTGTGTSVEFSKATVAFAKRTVGTTSPPQMVALTNVGTAVLNITSVGIAGTDPADFAQTNTCSSPVNPGANCSISVTFTPTATGSRTATISVVDDGGGSPQTVKLDGTGK